MRALITSTININIKASRCFHNPFISHSLPIPLPVSSQNNRSLIFFLGNAKPTPDLRQLMLKYTPPKTSGPPLDFIYVFWANNVLDLVQKIVRTPFYMRATIQTSFVGLWRRRRSLPHSFWPHGQICERKFPSAPEVDRLALYNIDRGRTAVCQGALATGNYSDWRNTITCDLRDTVACDSRDTVFHNYHEKVISAFQAHSTI